MSTLVQNNAMGNITLLAGAALDMAAAVPGTFEWSEAAKDVDALATWLLSRHPHAGDALRDVVRTAMASVSPGQVAISCIHNDSDAMIRSVSRLEAVVQSGHDG